MLLKSFIIRAICLSALLNVFDSTLQTEVVDDNDNDLNSESEVENKTLSQEDIDELVHSAIEDVEEIGTKLNNKTEYLAQKLDDTIEHLKNKTLKYLQKIKKKVESGSSSIDVSLKSLLGYDISDTTCGVVNFRKATRAIFDASQTCAIKYVDKITDNIQGILLEGGRIADKLVNITEKIKSCSKDEDLNIKIIKRCISSQKVAARGIAKSAIIDQINIKNVKKISNWNFNIQKCVALESLGKFKNKTMKVWACLQKKVPGLAVLNDVFEMAGKFIDKDVLKKMIDPYLDELKKLPGQIFNGFKKGLKKMKSKFEKLKHFFKELAEKVVDG